VSLKIGCSFVQLLDTRIYGFLNQKLQESESLEP
jgi:hypothetical protein